MADESDPSHHHNWFDKISKILSPEPKNQQDLIEILHAAAERQLLDTESLRMIDGALKVSHMQARDIMIPRSQMVVIEHDQSLAEIIPIISKSGHSRFPVIADNKDEVVGTLLAKDLLNYAFQADAANTFNIQEILRPPVFVPEAKRLNILLKEFRLNKNHMAIVVDEYGGIAGLITIEDVLEEIVGNIQDEHDLEEEKTIHYLEENRYLVNGLTPIGEFNEFFNSQFSDDEFDTIGGLVMQNFERFPDKDEQISIANFTFKVLELDNRRIKVLEVTIPTSAI